tara:strand:+ start:43392 stop:44171 length:780 start_codon:yes stop_codon:yes gene_type:complete
MFFSGIDTKVTLINVPAWDANLIRTTTLPIRKHTITVKADGYSGRGGSISFFDYESGALIEYDNENSVWKKGIEYFNSIVNRMTPEDHKHAISFLEEIGDSFIAKSNAKLPRSSKTVVLDALAIQFGAEQSVTPIYSPASSTFETAMRGNSLVQGALTINFDKSMDRGLIQHVVGFQASMWSNGSKAEWVNIPPMQMKVDYTKKDLTKDDQVDQSYYVTEDAHSVYTLDDVRFISRAHGVQPDASAVMDSYQFIAKTLY